MKPSAKAQPHDAKKPLRPFSDNIVFVGDSDFASLFGSFGFRVFEASAREDFVKILKLLNDDERHYCVCAADTLRISDDEIARANPRVNVMFLPSSRPDIDTVKAMYKNISERASGVDLTRKLEDIKE